MKLYLNEDTIPFEDKFKGRDWAFDDEEDMHETSEEYENLINAYIHKSPGHIKYNNWEINNFGGVAISSAIYYNKQLVGYFTVGGNIIQMDYSIEEVNDFFEYMVYFYAKNDLWDINIIDGSHPRTDMYFGIVTPKSPIADKSCVACEDKDTIKNALKKCTTNDTKWKNWCIENGMKYIPFGSYDVLKNKSIYVNCPKYDLPAEVFSADNVIYKTVSGE